MKNLWHCKQVRRYKVQKEWEGPMNRIGSNGITSVLSQDIGHRRCVEWPNQFCRATSVIEDVWSGCSFVGKHGCKEMFGKARGSVAKHGC